MFHVGIELVAVQARLPQLQRQLQEAERQRRAAAARHGLEKLSMGMSGDLEAAVAEGATMVRIGTAVFGQRIAT